jgi:hypothetical protein
MNKLLPALGVLVGGALLVPDVADAQRGGRGGGGARIGGAGSAVERLLRVRGVSLDPEASARLRSPIPVAALTVAMTTASAIGVTGATAMARRAGAIRTTVDAIPIMVDAITDGTRTMAAGVGVPGWPRGLSAGRRPRIRTTTTRTPRTRHRSRPQWADTVPSRSALVL